MRILLVDDHSMFREGLRKLLETNPDFHVVAEASDGRQAVELAQEYNPDVVLMDVSMPGLNGVEATRKIINVQPQTKVVGLSMHTDRRYPSELLRAGASGYLPKDGSFDELERAVRAVCAGEVYLSPRLMSNYNGNGDGSGENGSATAFDRLTAREREVLQLMAEGQATKEIAATLHVSVKTVETHRRQIMEKLNIYSVAELTKYAIREGLTSIET
jgi:DNA-binding NarL/FixJ family response regulator